MNSKLFIILAVGALVGIFLISNLNSGSGTVGIATETDSLGIDDQEMITLLRKIQRITLDGSVFSDPAFLSLKDFSREIVEEPQSRDNPFAPPKLEESGGSVIITE